VVRGGNAGSALGTLLTSSSLTTTASSDLTCKCEDGNNTGKFISNHATRNHGPSCRISSNNCTASGPLDGSGSESMTNGANSASRTMYPGLAISTPAQPVSKSEKGWSVVPYVGLSLLGDQSLAFSNAENIADGPANVSVDDGFTAGLSLRYDYSDSNWVSEIGWEYRANDTVITTSDSVELPGGNYASNIFYVNGRYTFSSGSSLIPWVGGGVTWVQEIDLDSENSSGERSFSDSGPLGFQAMTGVEYTLSERFYLTSEIRYSNLTGLNLEEEADGGGLVSNIDYQPVTLSVGIGIRL